MLTSKNGNIMSRAAYAVAQMARDTIVAGTGVGAGATVALVLGDSMDPEVAAVVAVVSLGVWRVVRKNILAFLNGVIAGDGGVA